MTPTTSLLLADIFDRLRLQLPEGIVNWLTPVWILAVGAFVGIVLTFLLWGVVKLISLAPGMSSLAANRSAKQIAVAVLTVLLVVAALLFIPGLRPTAARAAQPAAAAQAADAPQADNATTTSRWLDFLWALGGTILASWLLSIGIISLLNPRSLSETNIALREGVLWPLFITAIVLSVFAVLGLFVVRRPVQLLSDLARWPMLARRGETVKTYEIPASSAFEEPKTIEIPVSFRKDEIQELDFKSDQPVKVRTEPFEQPSLIAITFDVRPDEGSKWRRESYGITPFRGEVVRTLYAKNFGDGPAKLTLTAKRTMATPQMVAVPIVALAMAGVFFLYLLQRAAAPKMAAISLSTAKSEIAQPIYSITMAIGIFLIIVFVFVPYFTLSNDIKMLKDSGLSLILVLGIIQAVWGASSSVAEEIEGKTALTVLSKPVSRRDFIIGKFVGIAWAVGLMVIILGLLLLIVVAYKPIYDFREGGYTLQDQSLTDPTWQNCFAEMVQIVPGLVLAFLETLVMAALSVAISTRLPALANFIICFAIYVLGHLTPLMVQSQVVAEQLPPVIFFGRLIATVLPVLDHFNIQASVAAGVEVPLEYLAWSLVYCALYSTIAMLLALTLFEDRDLA